MLLTRSAALAALLLAGCAARETAPHIAQLNPEDFASAGDACGASAYAHLVGERFAATHQAALPANARVIRHDQANTLEFALSRINVMLDEAGRVVAIGCF